MIETKIIADSRAPHGGRITTFVLKYPRFIHSEFLTHRVFSRNASSSRAIPVKKMLAQVIADPACPVHWGANQAGMQARAQLKGWRLAAARSLFLLARWPAVAMVWLLNKIGLHKQVANRLLEPWMYIVVVATASDLSNFFHLRYHPDAQPEFQELARKMWDALQLSEPVLLSANEWHLPFIHDWERSRRSEPDLLILSTARCARVSYQTHEGKFPTPAEDHELFKKLVGANPKHASPAEHQAMALPVQSAGMRSGNFVGWLQHRQCIDDHNITRLFTPPT